MQKCCFAAIAPAIALGLSVPSALANTPSDGSSQLLPLEARNLGGDVEGDRFQSVADQINQTMGPQPSGENVLDTDDMPWLESFIDEDGNARMPLGLTVFSTMGDPSVGFGGSF
jgi:hypothetical protein